MKKTMFKQVKLTLLAATVLGMYQLPAMAKAQNSVVENNNVEIKGLMSDKRIAGEYLVAFKADTPLAKIEMISKRLNGSGDKKTALKNTSRLFAASKVLAVKVDDVTLMSLASNPMVASIEVNKAIGVEVVDGQVTRSYGSAWGIDRIDQQSLPLDGQYSPVVDGLNTNVYVLDTGIYTAHNEFEGRASWAYTAPGVTGGNDDVNGHGTAMAGLVGSKAYGVAPKSLLHSVKVLDNTGSGTLTDLLSGLEYVQLNHKWPAVALVGVNLPQSTILTDAIDTLVDWGVSVAAPAGDESKDKCYAGLYHSKAMIVASSTLNDEASPYTNHGGCVDMYAPGLWAKTTWHTSPNANNSLSHSPVAAAYAAGAMALVRSDESFCAAHEVNEKLVAYANYGKLSNVPNGTANRLLSVPTSNSGYGKCRFPMVQDNNVFHNKTDFVAYNNALEMSNFMFGLPVDTSINSAYSGGITLSVDTGNFTVHSQGTLLEPDLGSFILDFDKSVNYIGFNAFITGPTQVTVMTENGQSHSVYLTSSSYVGLVSDSPIEKLTVTGNAGSIYNDFQGVN